MKLDIMVYNITATVVFILDGQPKIKNIYQHCMQKWTIPGAVCVFSFFKNEQAPTMVCISIWFYLKLQLVTRPIQSWGVRANVILRFLQHEQLLFQRLLYKLEQPQYYLLILGIPFEKEKIYKLISYIIFLRFVSYHLLPYKNFFCEFIINFFQQKCFRKIDI